MDARSFRSSSTRLKVLSNPLQCITAKPHRLVGAVCVSFLLVISISSMLFVDSVRGATQVDVTVNCGTIIGNNKLSLGFMLDHESSKWSSSSVQRQLSKDANFKLVRLFSVRIEPCTYWYESTKTGTFNWANVDSLARKIFEMGGEPLICLGKFNVGHGPLVRPSGMATNPNTGLPYSQSYAAYAAEWVRHFKAVGLPVRYYEIVNEPYFYYGWDSAETTLIGRFVTFFNAVANAMRQVNPGVLIGNDAFLQKKFLNYMLSYGVNLDYIDMHKYGLTESGGSDATAFYRAKTMRFTIENSLWYTLDQARQLWYNKRGKFLPTIISEANFSYAWMDGTDPRIQQLAGTIYTALVLRESVLRGVNYHLYYVFASSASASSTGEGFGMINSDNNQLWYPYYVQTWLGKTLSVGDRLVSFASSSTLVSGFAWLHNESLYVLLISETTESRAVYLHGFEGQVKFSKIDNAIYWKTPSVQNGTISSTQPITTNGYAVVLLQSQIPTSSLPAPPPPSPTPSSYLFEDGFETHDFSKWTGTRSTSGETSTVENYKPHSGYYHSRFASDGSGAAEEYAYAYKAVDLNEVHAQCEFYIIQGLPLVDEGDRVYLMRLNGLSQSLAYVGVRRSGGIDKWALYVRNGANWMSWKYASTPLPQMGKWINVELHWKMNSTQGLVELYIDGVRVIQVSGINTAYYGNVKRVDFGLTYASGVQNDIIIYEDDVKISNT